MVMVVSITSLSPSLSLNTDTPDLLLLPVQVRGGDSALDGTKRLDSDRSEGPCRLID
jgi:hypothetical protein